MKPTTTMILGMRERCLAAACRCVEAGSEGQAVATMKAEFRAVAREIAEWELGGIKKASLFLRPMERELVKRFGPLLGRETYWDFVDSFWIQSWTDVPLEESRLDRQISQTREWHWRGMAHRTLKRFLVFDDFSTNLHCD